MPHLPANLHVVQHYRISLDDQAQGEERAATNRPAAASSTTTTVTEARILAAVQQPPAVNLILLRGEVAHSIEVGGRLNLIDVLLFRLLERHLQDRPTTNEPSLVSARAAPPRMGYAQEVIVLLRHMLGCQIPWSPSAIVSVGPMSAYTAALESRLAGSRLGSVN